MVSGTIILRVGPQLALVEPEEALLVRTDLGNRDLVDPRVDVLADGCEAAILADVVGANVCGQGTRPGGVGDEPCRDTYGGADG